MATPLFYGCELATKRKKVYSRVTDGVRKVLTISQVLTANIVSRKVLTRSQVLTANIVSRKVLTISQVLTANIVSRKVLTISQVLMEKKEQRFVIKGGKPLKGEIEVLGSKNAATPILAASCLFEETVVIDNIPLIEDVFRMIDILESMGVTVVWLAKRTVRIDARNMNPEAINQDLVCTLRSSILFAGPLLARFGKCFLAHPGGCIIGARPLDTHFSAFKDLGVTISKKEKGNKEYYFFNAEGLHGGTVILDEFSVTATENILFLASRLKETVHVKLAAAEPHVGDVIRFLANAGVEIAKKSDHAFSIRGKKKLLPVKHRVINDYIEAGTFMALSFLFNGNIKIKGAPLDYLDAVTKKIQDAEGKALYIQTLPYPGFPTDLQAPFGLVATQLSGKSHIQDTLYENRFGYLKELEKMGVKFQLLNSHEVSIEGKTPLKGAEIQSFDLRAGITLILAGLIAKGETIIHNAYQVDRGYEKIEERLQKLGADIQRKN